MDTTFWSWGTIPLGCFFSSNASTSGVETGTSELEEEEEEDAAAEEEDDEDDDDDDAIDRDILRQRRPRDHEETKHQI